MFIGRLEDNRYSDDTDAQKRYIIGKFNEIMCAEYMLDYTIWEHLRNEKIIKEFEEKYDEYDLEEDPLYHRHIKKRA